MLSAPPTALNAPRKKYFVVIHADVDNTMDGKKMPDISGKAILTIEAECMDAAIECAYSYLPVALKFRFENTETNTIVKRVNLWFVEAREAEYSGPLYHSKTFNY